MSDLLLLLFPRPKENTQPCSTEPSATKISVGRFNGNDPTRTEAKCTFAVPVRTKEPISASMPSMAVFSKIQPDFLTCAIPRFWPTEAAKRKLYANKNRTTTMDHIDDKLKISIIKNPVDGSSEPFVREHTTTSLLCYTDPMIEVAVRIGIDVLVADGCHDYQPKELGRSGQLYTVHGVTKEGDHAPLFHLIAGSKSKTTYKKLFSIVKAKLEEFGCDTAAVRIVIDYEKAAISALTDIFSPEQVTGCSFHFSMALNRRRDKEGLKKHIEIYESVKLWYGRLLALTFLPQDFTTVSGVLEVPVKDHHPAFSACTEFLRYFKETWTIGMFSGMWTKYMIQEHRSTNAAEAYHSKLQKEFGGIDHPPLADLLDLLRCEELSAYHSLRRRFAGNGDQKRIRAHLKERQDAIWFKMCSFDMRRNVEGESR